MDLVTPGQRSRTERIEGWADILARKGSKKRQQAKVKRPQKSNPLCCTVCLRGLRCIFSCLLSCLLLGDMGCARDIERPTEKVKLLFFLSV